MVRRRRIRHAGAGSSTDALRDRWPWLRLAYRKRQTTRPLVGRGELLPFLSSLHHLACGTDTYSTAITDSFNAKKKNRSEPLRERSLRSPQVDDRAERANRRGSGREPVANLSTYAPLLRVRGFISQICEIRDMRTYMFLPSGRNMCAPAEG